MELAEANVKLKDEVKQLRTDFNRLASMTKLVHSNQVDLANFSVPTNKREAFTKKYNERMTSFNEQFGGNKSSKV